jgi:hypothetical protein
MIMNQHEEYTSPPGFRVSGGGGTKLAPVLIDPAAPASEGDVITRIGSGYAPQAPSGGGSGVLLTADFHLTNTQLKALPNSGGPLDVAAPPGAGSVIVPERAVIFAEIAADGGYVGVSAADSALVLRVGDADALSQVLNSTVLGLNLLESVLAPAETPQRAFVRCMAAFRSTTETSGGVAQVTPTASWENQPLRLHLFSDDGNDLTGGNAANVVAGRVWYRVMSTDPDDYAH